MIEVRMNLHSAITGNTSSLVRIVICNDGSGTHARGNYRYSIWGRRGQMIKQGEIRNWPRKSKTPAALLQRVLNDAYPKGTT